MALPTEPVTLTLAQVEELNQKLSTLRHDVNNSLTLITVAVELIRQKPASTERLLKVLAEQPGKIIGSVAQFTREMENSLRITHP